MASAISSCPGPGMSETAAHWCGAPSRPRRKSATSPLRPTAAAHLNTNLLAAGDPLGRGATRGRERRSSSRRKRGSVSSSTLITAQLGLIRTLRGLTPDFGSFNDGSSMSVSSSSIWRAIRAWPMPTVLVLDPQAAGALLRRRLRVRRCGCIEGSTAALDTSPSYFEAAEYHFYGALARAAHLRSRSCRRATPAAFRAWPAHHRQLAVWAENCPENFETAPHWSAPRSRASKAGSSMPSGSTNRPSARRARTASSTTRARQRTRRALLRGARLREDRPRLLAGRPVLLSRWGADGKVRQLDQLYPHLATEAAVAASDSTIGAPVEHWISRP